MEEDQAPTTQVGKSGEAALLADDTISDAANDKIFEINGLYQQQKEQTTETMEMKSRSKCCVTNITIGGVDRNALVDTGAEITCIS